MRECCPSKRTLVFIILGCFLPILLVPLCIVLFIHLFPDEFVPTEEHLEVYLSANILEGYSIHGEIASADRDSFVYTIKSQSTQNSKISLSDEIQNRLLQNGFELSSTLLIKGSQCVIITHEVDDEVTLGICKKEHLGWMYSHSTSLEKKVVNTKKKDTPKNN